MTTELTYLALLALLALAHVSVQGLVQKSAVGTAWTVGARAVPADCRAPMAERAARAMRSFLETALAFAAATCALHLSARGSPMTQIASRVYLGGRGAYIPAYLSGVRWLRTIIWNTSTAALAIVILGIWWPR